MYTKDWNKALEEARQTGKPIWKHRDGTYAVATSDEIIEVAEYEAGAVNARASAEDIADEWTEVQVGAREETVEVKDRATVYIAGEDIKEIILAIYDKNPAIRGNLSAAVRVALYAWAAAQG